MTSLILTTIGIGIAIGIGIVIAILVARVNPTFNSLENVSDFNGSIAEVIVATTPEQPGSIRVKRNGSTLKLRAVTQDKQGFRTGDKVLIVEVQGSQAWVTSAELDD